MKKRIFSILLCTMIFLSVALPAQAVETGSITVLFEHDEKPIENASFRVYKAAEWDGGSYTLVSPFSGYSVSFPESQSSEQWRSFASTLWAYASRDNVESLYSSKTDTYGKVRFDGLSNGLYLVIGSEVKEGNVTLYPQPMLISVPSRNKDGSLEYNIVTNLKYESEPDTGSKTVKRHVLKVWKDDGNKETRPNKVTVQLLRDGKVYDEKVLNEANNWRYTWTSLDADYDWQITEKEVPNDYTVLIAREGITFTVTNTKGAPPPDNSTETNTTTANSTESGTTTATQTEANKTTTKPATPNNSTTQGTSAPEKLPHTGLLWWPVPCLAAVGAISLFLGIYFLLNKKEEQNEQP